MNDASKSIEQYKKLLTKNAKKAKARNFNRQDRASIKLVFRVERGDKWEMLTFPATHSCNNRGGLN